MSVLQGYRNVSCCFLENPLEVEADEYPGEVQTQGSPTIAPWVSGHLFFVSSTSGRNVCTNQMSRGWSAEPSIMLSSSPSSSSSSSSSLSSSILVSVLVDAFLPEMVSQSGVPRVLVLAYSTPWRSTHQHRPAPPWHCVAAKNPSSAHVGVKPPKSPFLLLRLAAKHGLSE